MSDSIPGATQGATQGTTPLTIVIVGHVDHGKSTLVGRLIHDTGSMPDGKLEAIKAMSEKRGMPFEWAFLLDAFQAERDQGITIDTTQIQFKTAKRPYLIIDAPGHKEFLKNMITGAAAASAALLVIDAVDGVQEQSRRHGYLLHLLGIRQVAVVVNKMDMAGYGEARFRAVEGEIRRYLGSIGVTPSHVVPVSAREGDNIVDRSAAMPWYQGPTVTQALDLCAMPPEAVELPLRLPVQDVYKFDQRRIIAGRIESGTLKVGDTLLFSPSNKTARVASIEAWGAGAPVRQIEAGKSVGITLDEQIFVERGQIVSHVDSAPFESNVFRARIFWLGHAPLARGKQYKMKLATGEFPVEVQQVETVIDVADLAAGQTSQVERNGVAEIVLRSRSVLAVDEFTGNPRTGRFVLVESYDIVGGGIISMQGYPDQRAQRTVVSTNIHEVESRVSMEDRWLKNHHKSGVIWLTGLSGAGKTTLALALEHELHRRGYQVYVLDGDNIRHGLSADLGFSPDDRAENIRRVGEVSKLFAQAGTIVVTAFISPYRADRDHVREIAGDLFHEIHVKADVATCESRDPKGLYKKARAGQIKDFTGISAPYEEPEAAELVIDTSTQSIDQSIALLLDYVGARFTIDTKQAAKG
ncbi:adenylyl-sulfate kinase [Oceanibaculum pacificum]|uniref:Adenylyl-sulfate kinase n=1 Tax=Oceanibaculum pacificum TaxID=580166 RepID=A0A154VF97_9PROT|nr:adenylyl-sulfate kinase [Oceanibaculum pacificum]KZD00014.1 NodQ bifunctional enzyme [Oceanibaculum pacificum]